MNELAKTRETQDLTYMYSVLYFYTFFAVRQSDS